MALVPDAHRRVLCVDDDANALASVQRVLRSRFDVTIAPSSRAAVQLLDRESFGVIVTDLRMPGMDGVHLLAHARSVTPDTVRILISGQADLESALQAINEGQLFRFLLKPCSGSDLLSAVVQASDFNRSVTAERVLLEQTLTASVGALVDLLAITQPESFGRASRLKRYAEAIATELGLAHHWALGVAAQLSQVGYIIVPEATATKARKGLSLTAGEQALIDKLVPFSAQLVASIPRLEPVCAILRLQYESVIQVGADAVCERSSQILRLAMAFDSLESAGCTPVAAIDHLERSNMFERTAVAALRRLTESPMRRHHPAPDVNDVESTPASHQQHPSSSIAASIQEVDEDTVDVEEDPFETMMLSHVSKGMQFEDDVISASGVLLVARGQEVTASLVERILHSWSSFAPSLPVRVQRKSMDKDVSTANRAEHVA